MRIALVLVVFVGLLFAFVYPTRTLLDQRTETNQARQQLSVLQAENARLAESEAPEHRLRDRAAGPREVRARAPGRAGVRDRPRAHDRHACAHHDAPEHRGPRSVDCGRMEMERRRGRTAADVAAVRPRLGRAPRADFDVVVRDAGGAPVVVRNAPFTRDGTPMPTRYWLVDPDLNLRISRLEAAGGVREAEAAVDPDELRSAHDDLRRRARRVHPGRATAVRVRRAGWAAPASA